jgi:hypothetical protein
VTATKTRSSNGSMRAAGPPDATTNDDGCRTYRWVCEDGTERELLSVTSIRKLCGEPFGLVSWQITQVIDRALDRRRELDAILLRPAKPRERVRDKNVRAEAAKWLRAAATETRDKAADKGTDIHTALEMGFSPEEANEQTRPYIRQVHHFLDDSGYEIVAQEQQTWNLTVGYAGTLDVIFRHKQTGKVVVGDWKTSKSVYLDHVAQLHFYLGAEFIGKAGKVDAKMTALLQEATTGGILHLRPDGWSWHEFEMSEEVLGACFGSARFAQLLARYPKPDPLFSVNLEGSAPE